MHRQNFGEHFQLAILDSRTPALNGEPNYIYIYVYIYMSLERRFDRSGILKK